MVKAVKMMEAVGWCEDVTFLNGFRMKRCLNCRGSKWWKATRFMKGCQKCRWWRNMTLDCSVMWSVQPTSTYIFRRKMFPTGSPPPVCCTWTCLASSRGKIHIINLSRNGDVGSIAATPARLLEQRGTFPFF
jgi:hypothetical protein